MEPAASPPDAAPKLIGGFGVGTAMRITSSIRARSISMSSLTMRPCVPLGAPTPYQPYLLNPPANIIPQIPANAISPSYAVFIDPVGFGG